MDKTKNKRLLQAGLTSLVAMSAWASAPALAAGEGEGEGGEAHPFMSADEKSQLSLGIGLGVLEAELEAGWAQVVAGNKAEGEVHFQAAKAFLEGPRGKELEEAGLDSGHIAGELGDLIEALGTDLTVEDLQGIYEHGLFEIDEHGLVISPIMNREGGFAVEVATALLGEAGEAYQAGQRDEDAAALRRAARLVGEARDRLGRSASDLMAKDADRFKAAVAIVDGLPGKMESGEEASAILSDISRVELMVSGLGE